jgi:hypothetical protein
MITLLFMSPLTSALAATLAVGPGKPFSTPCRAFAAAADNDIIEIDAAGSYVGDVCGIARNGLTIRGVNGRPKIDAGGRNAMGKGIWVVQGSNTVIENVEMFGAKVPDRNGAALRLDGKHLTLRRSFLHHNENGILTNNDGVSDIVIENSEFGRNGYGDGYSHNLYIGRVNSLVFTGNYSHDANVGHNLKSRAQTNTITYNRFSSLAPGQTGSTEPGAPSYEIDLPNAGVAYVIGNIIQQPSISNNPGMLTFGVEGATNTKQELYVVNNTFLNDDSSRGTFVSVGSGVTSPILLQNNIFAGTGTVTTQSNAIDKTNYRSLTPAFVNRAGYDLRPAAGSAMINTGSTPASNTSGVALAPFRQYKHTAQSEARVDDGKIDIGAYEAGTTPTPTPTPTPSPTPAPDVTAPTVRFVAPTNNTTVTTFLSVNVAASDNKQVTKIVLLLNGRQIGYALGSSLRGRWSMYSVPAGSHTLSAVAYDAANNSSRTSLSFRVVKSN